MQYMKFHLKKQFQFIPISPTIAPKGKESIEEEGRMQQEWQKTKNKKQTKKKNGRLGKERGELS